MDCEYVLIVGQGRSGTNWLLELLDQHPETHCRNEPNELKGSPFELLPTKWVQREQPASFANQWDEAVRLTASSVGARDAAHDGGKRHISSLSRRAGLVRIMDSRKARAALGLMMPMFRREEWPMPGWVANREQFESALPVLKLNQVPGWATWVLEHRPQARVLHIVRHAGGFLNSWRKRYLALRDQDRVQRENRQRLMMIAEASGEWRERLGDIETMSVDESELWFWRYAAETIDEAGEARAGYKRMIYEELAHDPIGRAKEVYDFCGLSWSDEIERAIKGKGEESQAIAKAWRSSMSGDDVAMIDRVMSGSRMASWWQ